ncbi:hypothetical protein CYMTET_20418 [Cymbomonas tetramitiformis]|uniref:Helicase ATP-binding domain-containing protein n=1 Tax=Cymbomonas tetramitiformis TaxID=36881 RepID=A0AAE0G5H1_9CHLO|nr:hypothetical protein CYMTET_20418 [Cymbomonas tetramitiformis]
MDETHALGGLYACTRGIAATTHAELGAAADVDERMTSLLDKLDNIVRAVITLLPARRKFTGDNPETKQAEFSKLHSAILRVLRMRDRQTFEPLLDLQEASAAFRFHPMANTILAYVLVATVSGAAGDVVAQSERVSPDDGRRALLALQRHTAPQSSPEVQQVNQLLTPQRTERRDRDLGEEPSPPPSKRQKAGHGEGTDREHRGPLACAAAGAGPRVNPTVTARRLYTAHSATQITELEGAEHVAAAVEGRLSTELYDFQVRGVTWMVQREKLEDVDALRWEHHPLWAPLVGTLGRAPLPAELSALLGGRDPAAMYYNRHTHELRAGGEPPAGAMTVPGGILADEMGLGKTLMTLALHAAHPWPGLHGAADAFECGEALPQPVGCTLLLVPERLLQQWRTEISLHVVQGEMAVAVYLGAEARMGEEEEARAEHGEQMGEPLKVVRLGGRHVDPGMFAKFGLVLASLETLTREGKFKKKVVEHATRKQSGTPYQTPLLHTLWWRVVVDEATAGVGHECWTKSQLMQEIPGRNRWCLTGTPIDKDFTSMGGMLAFLEGKKSPSESEFQAHKLWTEAVEALRRGTSGDHEVPDWAEPVMSAVLQRVMLRRTKTMVEHEIPTQTSVVKSVHLSEMEKMYYARVICHIKEDLEANAPPAGPTPEDIRRYEKLQETLLGRLRGSCIHLQTSLNRDNGASADYLMDVKSGTGWEFDMFFSAILPHKKPTPTKFLEGRSATVRPLRELHKLCIAALRYNLSLEQYFWTHRELADIAGSLADSAEPSRRTLSWDGDLDETWRRLENAAHSTTLVPSAQLLEEAGEVEPHSKTSVQYNELRDAMELELNFARSLMCRVLRRRHCTWLLTDGEVRRETLRRETEEFEKRKFGEQKTQFNYDFQGTSVSMMHTFDPMVTSNYDTHFWRGHVALELADRYSEHFAGMYEARRLVVKLISGLINDDDVSNAERLHRELDSPAAKRKIEKYRGYLNIEFDYELHEQLQTRGAQFDQLLDRQASDMRTMRDEWRMLNTESKNSFFRRKRELLCKMAKVRGPPSRLAGFLTDLTEGRENARRWLERFEAVPVPTAANDYGSKITLVLSELDRLAPAKVIIVSSSPDTLAIMMAALESSSFGTAWNAQSKFQSDPEVQVFCLNGVRDTQGLTLTAAQHIFLLDPLFNPEARKQCYGRVHRVGQLRETVVHHFLTEGTVERLAFDQLVGGDLCAADSNATEASPAETRDANAKASNIDHVELLRQHTQTLLIKAIQQNDDSGHALLHPHTHSDEGQHD